MLSKKDVAKTKYLIDEIVAWHLSDLLPYYSQLCNKICIANESRIYFQRIIGMLLEKFPHQTFWNTLYLVNSRKEETANIAVSIVRNLPFESRIIFMNTQKTAQEFIRISQAKGKTLKISDFPISTLFPLSVCVPGKTVMINSIKDEIHVFTSLQAPKKIVLVGEDGVSYPMIVKFKDDLRKDSRVMDLDLLINKLFADLSFQKNNKIDGKDISKNDDITKNTLNFNSSYYADNYYIRNYNVIPFTHDSGIIEFLPNLRSLKDICLSYYYNINEIAIRFKNQKRIGIANMPKLLEYFKPILNKHFKQSFLDPCIYYRNRENYTKTYAIMCVIGWFIGLGDRHAENTHFDTLTGDTVHVDLNCIFDKAKTLAIPEKVPFRLTQNILDGFGILATSGTFKHTMRHTLSLLKNNKDAILANLLSFVFDPLFEWARKKNEPKRIIEALAAKLDYEDEDEVIDQLIAEATSHENLAAMYIGWMAFL